MAKFKMIFICCVSICLLFQCTRKEEKYVRFWNKTGRHGDDSISDMTGNLFYDFTIKKSLFTEAVFDTLYSSKEYSIVTINKTSYYVFKRDEFFKHKKYKSLKIDVMSESDSNGCRVPIRGYYVMQHYGIITIFQKKETYDLRMIVHNGDTINVKNFFP